MGIKEMFNALFATGADIEDDELNVEFTPEQQNVLNSIEEKKGSVESTISETEQSKAIRGLRKKYEAPDIKGVTEKSQENLEKMTEILKGKKADREIGE